MALTQISRGGIKDDAVTDAKLPANSVGNSEMKDDAVGVAELSASGTAGNTTYLRGDNTWTVPPDTNTQVGGSTGVDFNDDIKSRWGTGNDIEIYHRNSDSSAVIKNVNDTGFLRILSGDSDSSGILLKNRDDGVTYLRAKNEAGVELYYADSVKFETTSTGVNVTGLTDTDTLNVSSTSTFIGDMNIDGSLMHNGDTNTLIKFPAADTIGFETGGSERLRIDSSGNVLIGLTTARVYEQPEPYSGNDTTPALQIEGTGGSGGAHRVFAMTYNNNDVYASTHIFGKTRGGAVGGTTIVNNNDPLGILSFQGSDGSDMEEAAAIRAEVDGTPGDNDMPGRLVFATTADGAHAPTERVRIDSSGRMMIGVQDTAHASGNADDLCVGNNDSTSEHGITIGSNLAGGIRWADSASGSAGVIEYVHSDNRMTFSTNGSERLRILSGGGVTFNGDTATANALDDYEEGTFTPTWNNVTNKSTHAVWNYIKVGNLVHVSGWFRCNTTTNSGSDGVSATLPFTTAQNPTNGYVGCVGNIMYENINSYSSGNFVTLLTDNTSTFYPYKCQQNGGWENLRSDDVSADDNMIISFCYRI